MSAATAEIMLDLKRSERIRLDEAIFCAGKSHVQIDTILGEIEKSKQSCLLTRLSEHAYQAIQPRMRELVDYDPVSRTGLFNWTHIPLESDEPQIAIVTAGSTDVPVAREAMRTLQYFHVPSLLVCDVGVAGLWRLMNRIDQLRLMPIIIAVAGMDAALPSVLGGLYGGLIIAVPTSVGYGVASGGRAALDAILASCASGIVAVNIDNGYGAACAALRSFQILEMGLLAK